MSSKSNVSSSSISDLFRPNNPRGLKSRDLSNTRLDLLKREIQTNVHLLPLADMYAELQTHPEKGLSSAQAAQLLAYHGPNALTPATENHWTRILVKAMCTGFSVLIWLGALLCIMAYLIESSTNAKPSKDNLYLGCVLIAVDGICGLFSFFQNYKSRKIMETFKSLIPNHAYCIRDGVHYPDIDVRDIVKGDLVYVKAGETVPADIRIINSKGFKVDNSSLTGESAAVYRSNTEGTINILESPNVAFFSTQCVEGWAYGVALCCGDLTALGRVAGLAARLQPGPSPLAREIFKLMRYMSIWAVSLGFFIAVSAITLGYPFMQTTIFVIGIIVANIPEGLQPTVTSSLTLTAQNMVKRNCLVKNLEAVEALGACTAICSDKTGTLTKNIMCVRDVWFWNKTYSVRDQDFPYSVRNSQVYKDLRRCAMLCSNATIFHGAVKGDASETAIFTFVNNDEELLNLRTIMPKICEIPFNSTNKYQVSVHFDKTSSKQLVMMKGAPEVILTRCAYIATDKKDILLDKEITSIVERVIETLANEGKRILAFADLELNPIKFPLTYKFDVENVNFPTEQLRLLGLMALLDPPREEVSNAIQRVRAAGVRVMMVTGDHPGTARAIAAEVGIATSPHCLVLTGVELRTMTADVLDKIIIKNQEIVFARTSPTQKLQIVEACQRCKHVVAVTGDGVNDSPALRQADIGISMGITGTQVSKQTADIILMDDNFATIVVGIEEGRKIFDNLKKSLCYILISNVPEIMPVLMFILFSIPLPLGAMTILCVDLGTDMWPSVALSYEVAESDVMCRPPRQSDPLISKRMICQAYWHLGIIEFAAGMFAYFIVMAEHGFQPKDLFGIREQWDNEAVNDLKDSFGQEWTYAERKEVERACQATYFIAIVLMQVTNGIICKTRFNSLFHVGMKNKILNYGFVFEIILACIICYVPGVNNFFRTYPIKFRWWFLAMPFAVFMFAFDEFRKYCIRRQLFGGWYNKLTYY